MQGIASNASAGIYMIQEFKVYETVDKTQLNTLLKQAEELIKKMDSILSQRIHPNPVL